MINRDDREAQDLTEVPTYWSQTIVLPCQSIDRRTPEIAESVSGLPLSTYQIADSSHCTPDAAADVSHAIPKRSHRPTPKTLKIIRLIQRGLSNDEIVKRLPDESIGNVRTVRARLKNGKYVL